MKCNKCQWNYNVETTETKEKYKEGYIVYDVWSYHCNVCGDIHDDKETIEWTAKSLKRAKACYDWDIAHPVEIKKGKGK